ncbi:MAG: hypothetical protein QGG64_17615 [Candidatus Latescibacteria bacterium]|nr:hypothetical protein [Candidatus Latescibacterota bacterium]
MNTHYKIPRSLRTLARSLIAALLLTTSAYAQNVSVTDYSVPVSRGDNLRIDGLSFNYTTEGGDIINERGDAGLIYKKFYSSLPTAYFFDLLGSASYNREPSGNRTGTFAMDFDVQIQRYFRETNKFFYSLSPDVLVRKGFDQPQVDVILGLGYGRFINATALRKAVRIEDFLMKEGVIEDHMPKDTMIELGHIIEKEDEYRDLYDERSYQSYWYEDMSNEINKTGLVLSRNLGPIGILRMREVLTQEQINDRFFGWDINAGAQFQALTSLKGENRRPTAMAINLRYSRPVSWSTQINTDLKFDTPFNDDFGREYNVTQKIDFIYEITNKIAFTTTNTFRMTKTRLRDAKLSLASTNSFTLFIENKISLTAIEQLSKAEGAPSRQSFNIALNYRIF